VQLVSESGFLIYTIQQRLDMLVLLHIESLETKVAYVV